jgi:hypothetical protein
MQTSNDFGESPAQMSIKNIRTNLIFYLHMLNKILGRTIPTLENCHKICFCVHV